MTWTYDPTNLNSNTAAGRTNAVRLLIGDVDDSDEQMQNEEIDFALAQSGTNVYVAASFACKLLAAKYSRLVDTELDGALESKFSDRIKNYTLLSIQMAELGKRMGGRSLGMSGGGVPNTPIFTVKQFDPPDTDEYYV